MAEATNTKVDIKTFLSNILDKGQEDLSEGSYIAFSNALKTIYPLLKDLKPQKCLEDIPYNKGYYYLNKYDIWVKPPNLWNNYKKKWMINQGTINKNGNDLTFTDEEKEQLFGNYYNIYMFLKEIGCIKIRKRLDTKSFTIHFESYLDTCNQNIFTFQFDTFTTIVFNVSKNVLFCNVSKFIILYDNILTYLLENINTIFHDIVIEDESDSESDDDDSDNDDSDNESDSESDSHIIDPILAVSFCRNR